MAADMPTDQHPHAGAEGESGGAGLLPCPFCGSSDVETMYVQDGRRARCAACGGASGCRFNGRADQPSADERAREAWNRRALSASSTDADAGLNEALTMTGCRDEADLIDHANIGLSFMDALSNLTSQPGPFHNWSPADDPAEIVFDLVNHYENAAAGWADISTAPRDGTPVDLWSGVGRWTDAKWNGRHWVRFSHGRGKVAVSSTRTDDQFTHWRPTPDGPDAIARRRMGAQTTGAAGLTADADPSRVSDEALLGNLQAGDASEVKLTRARAIELVEASIAAARAQAAPAPAGGGETLGPRGQPWCQPGDERDRVFILRFSDPDMREHVFTGEDAEELALKAWRLYAPTWNVYLLSGHPWVDPGRFVPTPDAPAKPEGETLRSWAASLRNHATTLDKDRPSMAAQNRAIANYLVDTTKPGQGGAEALVGSEDWWLARQVTLGVGVPSSFELTPEDMAALAAPPADAPAKPGQGGEGALREAAKRLTYMARTTGGTGGPDAELMAACYAVEAALAEPPANAALREVLEVFAQFAYWPLDDTWPNDIVICDVATPGYPPIKRGGFGLHARDFQRARAALTPSAPRSPADGVPEPPPWPPGAGNNARREGWKAMRSGQARTACPFPADRDDLRKGFEEGWDTANAADGAPSETGEATKP